MLALGACMEPQTQPKTAPGARAQTQPAQRFGDWFKPAQKTRGQDTGPSEIMKVVCFYRPNPFMSFDRAGDPDPEGFTFTLFLISRHNTKGVLENGSLTVRMFRIDPRAPATERRTLVREWTVETGTLVQSTRPHPLFGMGYQPQFAWEKSDDVLGREIEVVAAFTTRDGRTIQSQTKALRVPAHKGR